MQRVPNWVLLICRTRIPLESKCDTTFKCGFQTGLSRLTSRDSQHLSGVLFGAAGVWVQNHEKRKWKTRSSTQPRGGICFHELTGSDYKFRVRDLNIQDVCRFCVKVTNILHLLKHKELPMLSVIWITKLNNVKSSVLWSLLKHNIILCIKYWYTCHYSL